MEGVLGRGVFVGLPLRDDENVDMRRSQDDLVVSEPMLWKSWGPLLTVIKSSSLSDVWKFHPPFSFAVSKEG